MDLSIETALGLPLDLAVTGRRGVHHRRSGLRPQLLLETSANNTHVIRDGFVKSTEL